MPQNKRKKNNLSIVLPVYNEEKMIRSTIKSANQNGNKISDEFEILIINDGSTDRTSKIINSIMNNKIRIINHSKNKGIEKTVKELYDNAKYELIFFNGADGDIDMSVMLRLYDEMNKKNADIVVGNRVVKNYSIKRKIISTSYNNLVFVLAGVRVYDAGTVKLVKKKFFAKVKVESESVFGEAERLIRAVKNGAVISKVDILQNINDSNDEIKYKELVHCIKDLLRISFKARIGKL